MATHSCEIVKCCVCDTRNQLPPGTTDFKCFDCGNFVSVRRIDTKDEGMRRAMRESEILARRVHLLDSESESDMLTRHVRPGKTIRRAETISDSVEEGTENPELLGGARSEKTTAGGLQGKSSAPTTTGESSSSTSYPTGLPAAAGDGLPAATDSSSSAGMDRSLRSGSCHTRYASGDKSNGGGAATDRTNLVACDGVAYTTMGTGGFAAQMMGSRGAGGVPVRLSSAAVRPLFNVDGGGVPSTTLEEQRYVYTLEQKVQSLDLTQQYMGNEAKNFQRLHQLAVAERDKAMTQAKQATQRSEALEQQLAAKDKIIKKLRASFEATAPGPDLQERREQLEKGAVVEM